MVINWVQTNISLIRYILIFLDLRGWVSKGRTCFWWCFSDVSPTAMSARRFGVALIMGAVDLLECVFWLRRLLEICWISRGQGALVACYPNCRSSSSCSIKGRTKSHFNRRKHTVYTPHSYIVWCVPYSTRSRAQEPRFSSFLEVPNRRSFIFRIREVLNRGP